MLFPMCTDAKLAFCTIEILKKIRQSPDDYDTLSDAHRVKNDSILLSDYVQDYDHRPSDALSQYSDSIRRIEQVRLFVETGFSG